ncbi:hypothetical protein Hanom_Chr16g01515181 [Helianthus anomalus]
MWPGSSSPYIRGAKRVVFAGWRVQPDPNPKILHKPEPDPNPKIESYIRTRTRPEVSWVDPNTTRSTRFFFIFF